MCVFIFFIKKAEAEAEAAGLKTKEGVVYDVLNVIKMAASSRAVFVVAAKRTPFGTFGGKLKGMTATDMCKVAATAAMKAGKVPPEAIDSVIVGNVAQVF